MLLVAIHSAAPGGAQAMGLAEARAFSNRCEILAVVPEGPLRASFEEFAEIVPEAPLLPTWPTTPWHWLWRLGRSGWDALRLARLIRRRRVDAVVGSSTVLFSPTLAARLARVPVVVHAREWPMTRLGRAVFALQRRWADAVVAVSVGMGERLSGPGRARVVQIADGIAIPPEEPRPARFESPLRMCVVGSLTGGDGKGQHRAVETLGSLGERGIDATLTVVGPVLDRDYADRVRATARTLGVSRRVDMAGPSDDVLGLLREHDLLLFCSGEGADVTPLILMEAIAVGRPVVAADVGSVSEVLDGGRFGELVPAGAPDAMAEAVARVAADPVAAQARAAEGRRHLIERYDRDAGIERLWDLVGELLSHSPRA